MLTPAQLQLVLSPELALHAWTMRAMGQGKGSTISYPLSQAAKLTHSQIWAQTWEPHCRAWNFPPDKGQKIPFSEMTSGTLAPNHSARDRIGLSINPFQWTYCLTFPYGIRISHICIHVCTLIMCMYPGSFLSGHVNTLFNWVVWFYGKSTYATVPHLIPLMTTF